jgi:hypothetical protein
MIAECGNRTEYRNEQGQLHREDGPAVVYTNGNKYYYKNGLIHREDGPAIEFADGEKHYFINGLMHNENGPAAEYKDGSIVYYRNGLIQREDGPAIIDANGEKQYWMRVGTDSRGYNFRAFYCKNYPDEVKYRVMAGCRDLTGPQALKHWKDNPECLELAKKAIAKFETIKALIERE